MTFNKAQQKYIDDYCKFRHHPENLNRGRLEEFAEGFKEISNEPDPEWYKIEFYSGSMFMLCTTIYDLTLEEATVYLLEILVNTKWRDVKNYIAGEYLEKHNGDKWKVVKQ